MNILNTFNIMIPFFIDCDDQFIYLSVPQTIKQSGFLFGKPILRGLRGGHLQIINEVITPYNPYK